MIDGQPSAVQDSSSSATPSDRKHARSPEEEAAKGAKKAAEESEKALEKAEKTAERWEKQQDRLAKLHLDGDKLILRWLRTSLFLVTSGIAVERGLTYFERSQTGPSLDPYAVLRLVGISLVLVGLASLWIACVQHRQRLRAIRQSDPPPIPTFSLSLWVSVAVALLAVVALVGVLASYVDGRPIAPH